MTGECRLLATLRALQCLTWCAGAGRGRMAKVVLIHTVAGLENMFGPLCDEVAPGLAPSHLVDESLLNDTIAAGTLTDDVRARFRARAEQARADGADVIMLT